MTKGEFSELGLIGTFVHGSASYSVDIAQAYREQQATSAIIEIK